MIFDIYLSYSFQTDVESPDEISFFSFDEYKGIKGNESKISLERGFCVSLNRGNISEYYLSKIEIKLIVFGEVYSNKKFNDLFNIKPHKLTVEEIYDVYKKKGNTFLEYFKGNFNIIIIDEINENIKVFTDKLNVLPLYYAFNTKQLIISSNVSLILQSPWVDKSVDKMAIAMQYLFDYMLDDFYFVKGIRRIENAKNLCFSKEGMVVRNYWDVSNLYHKELMPKSQSLDLLAKQLEGNVALYSSDKERILVSLTGGFDGRTNVALLNRRPKDSFLTYSYGMEGSKQIKVPEDISLKTGIKYEPIYLGDDFLDSYTQNSWLASYYSNGTAPIGFCNIPYAFKKLEHYSDTILTGLFGSEILRPLHNNGIQVNDNSFAIFLSNEYKSNIALALKKGRDQGFITNEIDDSIAENLANYFKENYFKKYSDFNIVTRFFFFIIQEGIRKYFSQEISIERVYVNTRIPYFDIDMVELIYKTPWAGMYNGFLGESKFKRRKGQLLYAYIIKKYYPQIGKIDLDRGYKPNDLLLPFPLNYLKIAFGVYNAKKYMKKRNGNDTFKTKEWSSCTIKNIESTETKFSISNENFYDMKNKLNDSEYLTYRHFISIKSFLNKVQF